MNSNIKYRPISYYYEKPDKNLYLFDKIEKTISLSPQEVQNNLLYKNENGECHILYEGRERNGIILGGSTRGSMTIGLLPE
jgi:hypothetical protein